MIFLLLDLLCFKYFYFTPCFLLLNYHKNNSFLFYLFLSMLLFFFFSSWYGSFIIIFLYFLDLKIFSAHNLTNYLLYNIINFLLFNHFIFPWYSFFIFLSIIILSYIYANKNIELIRWNNGRLCQCFKKNKKRTS